ncbi:MAG: formylglycine-generating enzyme family protein, partial [Pirellulaceae bacterium]
AALHGLDADSGVHFATEWILRRFGEPPAAGAPPEDAGQRSWMMSPQGIALAVIRGPQEFTIGSPGTESEREDVEAQQVVQLQHSFAIGAYEITVEQYQRYLPDKPYAAAVTSSPQSPMSNVTWYDAARFCRLLSEAEGIPEEEMVYPPVDEIKAGMSLPDDWQRRSGYRLPSEQEWECACRSGTRTARFFGRLPARLPAYARYIANSNELLWSVGSLRPNPWGLFDIYGNVLEWCHDRVDYAPPEPRGDEPEPGWRNPMRSGHYRSVERENRSAKRYLYRPTSGLAFYGFRVARTMPDQ